MSDGMSKFQVGDKVRVHDPDNPYPGVVESVKDDKALVDHPAGARLWWSTDALVHDGPHVSDVDDGDNRG